MDAVLSITHPREVKRLFGNARGLVRIGEHQPVGRRTYHDSASGAKHLVVAARDRRVEFFTVLAFNLGGFPSTKHSLAVFVVWVSVSHSPTSDAEPSCNYGYVPIWGSEQWWRRAPFPTLGPVNSAAPIHDPTSESYYMLPTSYYCSAPPHPAHIRRTGKEPPFWLTADS
jgi:hypothetical protein